MPRMRYYCDYCDMYLPHGSATSRRQHNYGWKHRDNYRAFYEKLLIKQKEEELAEKRHLLPPMVVQELQAQLNSLKAQQQMAQGQAQLPPSVNMGAVGGNVSRFAPPAQGMKY